MPMIQPLIEEMALEGATTRRLLQRMPQEHLGWKPHAKARPLGELAMDIATVQPALTGMLQSNTADMASTPRAGEPQTAGEIVAAFVRGLATAKSLLSNSTEAILHSDSARMAFARP